MPPGFRSRSPACGEHDLCLHSIAFRIRATSASARGGRRNTKRRLSHQPWSPTTTLSCAIRANRACPAGGTAAVPIVQRQMSRSLPTPLVLQSARLKCMPSGVRPGVLFARVFSVLWIAETKASRIALNRVVVFVHFFDRVVRLSRFQRLLFILDDHVRGFDLVGRIFERLVRLRQALFWNGHGVSPYTICFLDVVTAEPLGGDSIGGLKRSRHSPRDGFFSIPRVPVRTIPAANATAPRNAH